MIKKKDTLKDLNEFMRNQPLKEEEETSYLEKKPTALAEVERLKEDIKKLEELPEGALNEDKIAELISKTALTHGLSERQVLFNICEKVLNTLKETDSADVMLHNTILYLKHTDLVLSKLK
ncbi:hypothetical protein GCM10011506_26860 [Marivirga lumbricoides]|uniref:Uncharacterized protein n=2 Tax=Marivirga lumbricoides TaxID=1046115 RepID=A0ABQ1MMZ9_9BACT|nr:hypothetical protein GCM10011506_26860 [Marivirga lumbricoides]